jgi:four helix bundle protein
MAFRFESLEVFQLAIEYTQLAYRVTKGFPREEIFGLTANLRRAATSVAMNLAEGAGRGTRRDFSHFVDVATGSLFETVAAFMVARRLGYVHEHDLDAVRASAETLGRKLSSFKKSLSGNKP